MSILVDKNTQASSSRASPAAPARSTRSRCIEYGTKVVGRRHARQGRPEVRGQGPGLRHRRRGGRRRPAPNASVHLRAAARRGRRDPRGRRRRHRSSSSASPRASRCSTWSACGACLEGQTETRLIGPNCPGVITPGRVQDRHHAGLHPQAGQHRRRVALAARSPTKPSASSRALGIGQSTCVGIGGDPVNGHRLHRRARAVQRRPGHRTASS